MDTKHLKLGVMILLIFSACRDNPFGKEIYKGKITDATTGKGIPGAKIEVRAKEMFKGFGYRVVGSAVTDENGNYRVSYERERRHSYLVYAFKEHYSDDDNYSWADHRHTNVNLSPLAYLKIRAINQSHRYEYVGFNVAVNSRYAEIRNCDLHTDTVMGNFAIPGNKDFELIYTLESKSGDLDVQKISIRSQEFELDSICIVY